MLIATERLLSALVAFGAVRRSSDGLFALSPSFRSLADPTFGHAVVNCSNFLNPTYQALPELLESTGYRNPDDPKNTAVQKAFGAPDTDLLGILSKKPEAGMGFGRLMGTWGEGHALLQHLYPVQSLADTYNAAVSPVMFVDVGGGYGQKAIALKNDFPDLPGKIIVQDLPMTIDRAPKVDGIDFAVHDFFTEQPIKGGSSYTVLATLAS
jgi:demethylsterigmatocystin 6-O-methyltransferase